MTGAPPPPAASRHSRSFADICVLCVTILLRMPHAIGSKRRVGCDSAPHRLMPHPVGSLHRGAATGGVRDRAGLNDGDRAARPSGFGRGVAGRASVRRPAAPNPESRRQTFARGCQWSCNFWAPASQARKDRRKKRKGPQMNTNVTVLDALSNRVIGCALTVANTRGSVALAFFLRGKTMVQPRSAGRRQAASSIVPWAVSLRRPDWCPARHEVAVVATAFGGRAVCDHRGKGVSCRRRQRAARASGIFPQAEDVPVLGRRRRRGPGNADDGMLPEVVTRRPELILSNDRKKKLRYRPVGFPIRPGWCRIGG